MLQWGYIEYFMENLRLILWYLCTRCQHITRQLQAASTYKRREIWHETHEPMWLLIGRIVFLHVKKKHCLQFWLEILLFLHVKNIICSSDFLEHTCVGKFMTIAFWWVFLSRYTIDCGTVHDFASTCSFSLVSFPFNPVRDNVCVSACGCLWCISQTYWFVVMVKE